MPNRILKESITTSDTLPRVSLAAEALFYRLIVRVDDFGRYHGESHLIYAHAMGNRIAQVSVEHVAEWLDELAEAGLLRRYCVDGRPYIELTTFGEHNPRRATASKFPAPTSENVCEQVQASACNCSQMQADACNREQMSPYSYSYSDSNSECSRAREAEPVDNPETEVGRFANGLTKAQMLAHGCVEAGSNEGETYAQFMAAYPKRRETARAWQAWCAELADDADPQQMVAAAKNYAAMVKAQGTVQRFIKLPATFLESGAWKDFVNGIPAGELGEEPPNVPTQAPPEPPPPKRIEYDPADLARAQAEAAAATERLYKRAEEGMST